MSNKFQVKVVAYVQANDIQSALDNFLLSDSQMIAILDSQGYMSII